MKRESLRELFLNELRDLWSRDRIMEAINADRVPCFAGYREVYFEKASLWSGELPGHCQSLSVLARPPLKVGAGRDRAPWNRTVGIDGLRELRLLPNLLALTKYGVA